MTGSTCTLPRSTECTYGDDTCWCLSSHWFCEAVDPQCPETAPQTSDSCADLVDATCVYGNRVCICPDEETWLCSGSGTPSGDGGAGGAAGATSVAGAGGEGGAAIYCPADEPSDRSACDVPSGTDCYYDQTVCICNRAGDWRCI